MSSGDDPENSWRLDLERLGLTAAWEEWVAGLEAHLAKTREPCTSTFLGNPCDWTWHPGGVHSCTDSNGHSVTWQDAAADGYVEQQEPKRGKQV